MYKVAAYNKKKNGMSETENFPYRVRLGLQHVFNLQPKRVGGWFYF